MFDPIALFDSIRAPSDSHSEALVFATTGVSGWEGYYIGRTASDEAALLIETRKSSSHVPPPLRLQSLAVYHQARCRISSDEQSVAEREFTVVWNTGNDPLLRRYFLQLLAPVVATLGKLPSSERVFEVVDAMAELFRALGRPSKRSTQGLWSELFLMSLAGDPTPLAKAWHKDPNERFDFSSGDQRLEVKSATGVRKHHFSLSQVETLPGMRILIASILTVRATGGLSVEALLRRLQARLASDAELQSHVYSVVAQTLASNLGVALSEAFDEYAARESLRFFWAQDIPRVPGPIPEEVSEVHFVADLSLLQPIDRAIVGPSGGLLASVLS